MKFGISILALAAMFGCSIVAAQPPQADLPIETSDKSAPKTDKVTYLGVTARPVDDTLRAQLNLPEGVGLIIQTIDRKGPAAADLAVNDVLHKLDDQLLIDAHQLVTLIHLHHPGDTVTLTVIREAKSMQITVKLSEKERPAAAPDPDQKTTDDSVWPVPFDTQLPTGPVRFASLSFRDDVYSANIVTEKDGHRKLTVKDMANKVVTEAIVDTPEQWAKLPPDIHTHLEMLHKMMVEQPK